MSIITEKDAKQRMRELVQKVKCDMELDQPPQYCGVDDPVANHLDIKVKEQVVSFGDGGMYLPNRTPPEIAIDRTAGNQERLNFTFFHEVSHHLIREDGELYGFLHDHSPRDLQPILEKYCNIGAAEFLVPENDIRQIITERGFSVELIRELDDVFPASKPAIAIQLAQCASHSCVVVVCEYGIIPRRNRGQIGFEGVSRPSQPQLFVRYSSGSPTYKYNTGRFIPISKEHLIMTAYQEQSLVKGRGNIPVHSGREWLNDCEAMFYKGNVYAVFNITAPPPSNQLPLKFF